MSTTHLAESLHVSTAAVEQTPLLAKPRGNLLFGLVRLLRVRMRMPFGKPLSRHWGIDRGTPMHRHYIDQFMHQHRADIRGTCLEFQDRLYFSRFTSDPAATLDILHIDEGNPKATVIADITAPNSIPDNSYDCVICTHVLHVIADLDAAVECLWRILKPGGVLLVASPVNSMCDESQGELWRFTRLGLQKLLAKRFGDDAVTTYAYGNSIVAAGELRGMTAEEFTRRELYSHDPAFACEVCARAVKSRRKRKNNFDQSRLASFGGAWTADIAGWLGETPLALSRLAVDSFAML